MLQKTRYSLLLPLALCLGLGTAALAQEPPFAALQQQAQQGDAAAQFQLGTRFDAGQDVPQNFAMAAKWFRAAAEQGNAAAQNQLGKYLQSGLGGAQNHVEAVKWLQQAAQAGDPQHLVDLATMYENGFGVAQDYGGAAALYRRAAQLGHLDAAVNLGVLYQNGTGVAQDYDAARALYLKPAEAGNARAQNNLGLLYSRGNGVTQDYEQAAIWFSKAAEAGLSTAMTNLGVMYENGFGVAQNDAKAAALYRSGGQQKDPETLLADIGFIPDPRLNVPSYGRATLTQLQTGAEQGDPVAQFLLAYLLISGPDATANISVAAHWFAAAAKAGMPAAMANLGLLYYRGLGVPQDYVSGYMWLTLAAAGNSGQLSELRDALGVKMTVTQINEAQTLASNRWQSK